MAYSPVAEILSVSGVEHVAIPIMGGVPQFAKERLTGCSVLVFTSSAELVAGTSEKDDIVAIAVFPIKGGVGVILDNGDDNDGTDVFGHNFVPALGPELFFTKEFAGYVSTAGWYVNINTDGDPVIIYYIAGA